MRRTPAATKIAEQLRRSGRARRVATDVERAGLVMTLSPRHQRIPVIRTEQRPGGDGLYLDAGLACLQRSVPYVAQPTQLLFTSASKMRLSDRDRRRVAAPCLPKQRFGPSELGFGNSDGFDV